MSNGIPEEVHPARWRRRLNLLDSTVRRALGEGSDEEFVDAIYRRWLGRPPEAQGAVNCLSELRSGISRRSRLSASVSSSSEAKEWRKVCKEEAAERRRARRADGLPGGDVTFRCWSRWNLLDSAVRRALGRRSDEEFVDAIFRRWLGRPPDAEDAFDSLSKLRSGISRRSLLSASVSSSPEAARRRKARKAEAAERRRARKADGLPERDLAFLWWKRRNLLDSAVRRAVGRGSDKDFVKVVYRRWLGRPPDAQGALDCLSQLRSGISRRSLLSEFLASSPEAAAVAPRLRLEKTLRSSLKPLDPRTRSTAAPEEVWLELTTRCNMAPPCSMCGLVTSDPSSGRHMEPRTWGKLLPLLHAARTVGLHGAGEPLLYPGLFNLLGRLGPTRTEVGFNSNGQLLSRAIASRLVENRLGWISVSLDAATPETYQRIRRRSDFDRLVSKIRVLVEERARRGSSLPRIEINMTLMRVNLPEAPAFVSLAAGLGVDGVMFQQIQPGGRQTVVTPDGWEFDYEREEIPPGWPRHAEVIAVAREMASEFGVEFRYEIEYGRQRPPASGPAGEFRPTGTVLPAEAPALCREPWRRLTVAVDGEAFFCCVHQANRFGIGNVTEEPAEWLWNGRRARLLRKALLSFPFPPCCNGCFIASATTAGS
jgi:MoaA/NifB/PqqE/SkfB family radical SAM enzyme